MNPTEEQVLAMIASAYFMEIEAGQKGCCVGFPPKIIPQIRALRRKGFIRVKGDWCALTKRGIEAARAPADVGLIETVMETKQ